MNDEFERAKEVYLEADGDETENPLSRKEPSEPEVLLGRSHRACTKTHHPKIGQKPIAPLEIGASPTILATLLPPAACSDIWCRPSG